MGPLADVVTWRALRLLAFVVICCLAAPAFAQKINETDETKIRDAALQRDRAYSAGNFGEAYRRGVVVLTLAKSRSPSDPLLVADSQVRLAMILEKLDRAPEAASNYEQACPVFVANPSGGDTRLGLCQHAQAMVLLTLNRADEAKPIYESAIQRLSTTMPQERVAAACYALAERLEETHVADEAIKYFELSEERFIALQPPQTSFAVTALSHAADLYGALGDNKDRIVALRKAIDLLSPLSPSDRAHIATLQFLLADTLIATGEFDEALALLKSVKLALTAAPSQGHAGPVAVLSRIAGLQIMTGVPGEASETVHEALDFVAKQPTPQRGTQTVDLATEFIDHAEVIKAYSRTTQFLNEIAKLDETFYEEWKSGAVKSSDLQGVFGVITNRIALYQINRSEYLPARKGLLASIEKTREIFGADSGAEIEILRHLSALALAQQDPSTAAQYAKMAIAISEKIPGDYSELYWGYGLALRQAGSPEIAAQMIDRSLKMKEDREGLSAEVLLRNSQKLSDDGDEGDLRVARLTAELAYLKNPNNPTLVSHLANLYAREKDWAQAIEAGKRAVDLRLQRYGPFHINTAAARYSLGQIFYESGQRKDALEQFLQCAAIFSGAVTDFEPQFSTEELRLVLPGLINSWTSALISMSSDFQDAQQLYDKIAIWKGRIQKVLRRRSIALRVGDSPEAKHLLDTLDVARNRIAIWLQRQSQTESGLWQSKLQELASNKEALERQIAELSGEGQDSATEPTAAKVVAHVAASEAFVDVFKFDSLDGEPGNRGRYAAFITRSDGTLKLVQLGTASDIDLAVRQWRDTIALPFRSGWNFLSSLVWSPLKEAIGDGVTSVWISPDAELSAIPWQLFAEDQHDSDRISGPIIGQVNSARDFVEMAGRANRTTALPSGPDKIVVLSELDYGPPATKEHPDGECWPQLEGTIAEGDLVEGLSKEAGFASIRLRGGDATKSRLSALLESSSFAHVATHGYFLPNLTNYLTTCPFRETPVANAPSRKANVDSRIPFFRSGLALSDANEAPRGESSENYLTADDFFGLRLRGVKMIVLSACETGLGDVVTGQGVLGLRTAVAASGAGALLMSLWKIPDAPTEILMQKFYRELWQNKVPAAVALLRAQAKLQHDPTYQAPQNWAGWILVGQ
jgi:hypothetical protein